MKMYFIEYRRTFWLHDSNISGPSNTIKKEKQPKSDIFLKQISPGLFDTIKIAKQKNSDKLPKESQRFQKTNDDNSINMVIKKILLDRKMNRSKSVENPNEENSSPKLPNRGNILQSNGNDMEQMINETVVEKQEEVEIVGQPCFAFELLEGIAEFGLGIIKVGINNYVNLFYVRSVFIHFLVC